MEPLRLWAAVEFTAHNGSTAALLTAAAQAGLHPYGVTALPGGFRAHCAPWQYRRYAALARKYHVRLRICKRQGAFFRVRPLLRRTGLWAGLALFVPLLLWSQQFVWAVDDSSLTVGQAARAAAALRETGLQPGASVTGEKLAAGEYALLRSGEFSWSSLNFACGRLKVELAAAVPKPGIAAGSLRGIRAKCSGTVMEAELASGTMLVVPGQDVEAGQGLIGTARSRRDGTLIFAPAAGIVRAQFEWSDSQTVPLREVVLQNTGRSTAEYQLTVLGRTLTLPAQPHGENAEVRTRHFQPETPLPGLFWPCSVQETRHYEQMPTSLLRTEEQAAALARLRSLQALRAAWPDAQLLARQESCVVCGEQFAYDAVYTIVADICE